MKKGGKSQVFLELTVTVEWHYTLLYPPSNNFIYDLGS